MLFWKRNTSTRSIDISTISTGSISGSRVSVWVAIARLITAETGPSGRSIDTMSYVAEKLLRVPDPLRCYLNAFSNILAETTVPLQHWYSLPPPLSLEDKHRQSQTFQIFSEGYHRVVPALPDCPDQISPVLLCDQEHIIEAAGKGDIIHFEVWALQWLSVDFYF